jgi:serine/threonine protein kinase
MLKKDGHVKLVDFGLAIELGSDSSLCGSLLYMSPEMLRDKKIGTFTDW